MTLDNFHSCNTWARRQRHQPSFIYQLRRQMYKRIKASCVQIISFQPVFVTTETAQFSSDKGPAYMEGYYLELS